MSRLTDISVRRGRLDFGGYHSLEHSLRQCSDRVIHARLWWSYFGQEAVEFVLFGWIASRTLCRLGVHTWLAAWDLNDRRSGQLCQWCSAWR